MGLFSFAKGIMEKNKLFQFFSGKHQPRISCQTLQMEGWATNIRKNFRRFNLEAYRHSQERGKWGQNNTVTGILTVN